MNYKRFTLGLLFSISTVSLLGSCNSKKGSETDDPINPPVVEPDKDTDVYFSSFYNGNLSEDCAVTLVTNKEEGTSLKNKTFNVFKQDELVYTFTFDDVTIYPNKPFVFANKAFTKLDLITDYEYKIVDEPIIRHVFNYEILSTTGEIIDSLGTKGFSFTLGFQQTLVRLQDYCYPKPKFRDLDFIRVNNSPNEFITTLTRKITLDELLTGPRLDEELYGNLPFSVDGKGQAPTGGYCKVTHPRLGDGDTTQFDFPHDSGIKNDYKSRVRYLYINTPEIDHGPGSNIVPEPWGNEAKRFNNDKIRSATSLIVQSNKGASLKDPYGRTLGFVWYTTVDNPTILDYRMLNFEMVLAGLAKYDDQDGHYHPDQEMNWQGINYYIYVNYAYMLAREQRIKIHGEKDPNFDY